MSFRYRATLFSLSLLLLSGLLIGFQAAPAQAQLKVEADIQLNKGDGKLSTTTSVSPKSGDKVVIEVFASGISNSLGFEAIIQFDNPAAVTAVEGSNQGGPYTLPLTAALKDGKANLTVGGFSGVTIPAGQTKFVGSMTVTLATGVSTLGIKIISADPGTGVVTQSISLSIAPALNNLITGVSISRTHSAATVSWITKFEGINHQVKYRASGATDWLTAQTALQVGATENQISALTAMRTNKVDIQRSSIATLTAALTKANITGVNDAFILALKVLDASVQARRHEAKLTGLTQNTTYEYEITATSLDGELSPANSGTFKTRATPDVRPADIKNVNVEAGPTSATIKWQTSRAGETRYKVYKLNIPAVTRGDLVAESNATDKTGRISHKAEISTLTPATYYEYEISTRLTGIDDLILDGSITEAQATTTTTGRFKTRSSLPPLELTRLPKVTTGSSANQIIVEANQPVSVILDYGLITSNDKPKGDVPTGDAFDADPLYPNRVQVSDVQEIHSIPLVGLETQSRYRYRITLVSLDNSTYTTDPRGKHKFSKDLTFRTLSDILPPEITRGPIVRAWRSRAWFSVRTNVPTTMTLYYGTVGGTFNTPDEFAVPDYDRNGTLQVTKSHSVVVTGLTGEANYSFRMEFKNVEGETLVWPTTAAKLAAGKQAGSVGAFATTATADTQNPLITKGPTVVSASQTSLTIEWETDEPATSAVSFGTSAGALDQETTDGDAVLKHQIVLTGLTSATNYAIKVSSTDVSGNGPTQSNVAYGTTLSQADITAPKFAVAPALVYTNNTNAEIKWIADELSNGQISYGTSATNLDKVFTATDDAVEQVLSLTGLTGGTQYFYQVSMTDANGNGPTTSSVLNFTTAATADTQAPVVSAVTVTPQDNSAIITWKTDEISDSVVRFGTSADALTQNLGDIAAVTEHRLILSNLLPGTTYSYAVQSIDRAGNGPTQSTTATFTTLGLGAVVAPTAPAGLTAKAGNNAVRLTWNAPTTAAIGLVLERAEATGEFAPLATLDIATEYLDNSVQNGVAYRYRLRAVGLQATGDPSTATEAITPVATGGPSAPKFYIVQGTPTTPTFVITNSTPIATTDVLTYTFQLSTQADFSDVITLNSGLSSGAGVGASDPKNVTAWTVERALTDGATYYYRVKANDGLFDSPFLTGTYKVNSKAAAYPGDFTGDLSVGFADFITFTSTFGKTSTTAGYLAAADLDGDGSVGFPDFLNFITFFNKAYIKGPSSGKLVVDGSYGIDANAKFDLIGHMVQTETGSELVVDVQLANVTNVQGYGVELVYDPAVFEFLTASEQSSALLQTDNRKADLFAVLDHNRESGQVFLGNAITQGSAVSGQGTLVTLHFKLIDPNPQTADIHIAQGILFDADRNGFAAQQLGGRFSILPTDYALEHNFPNPFNPETAIRYAVPEAGKVTLVIYNLLGQEINRLVDANQTPGFYTVRWNGKDALGRSVASGVYLYRLQANNFNKAYKMLLLK